MEKYIKKFPKEASFIKGDFFKGYVLSTDLGVEMDYIDMSKGHEYYQIENKCIHLYYVLKGTRNC